MTSLFKGKERVMDAETVESPFDLTSERLDCRVDEGVGIIDLKDHAFEIATDLKLKKLLFDRLDYARDCEEIKVILVRIDKSSLGEDRSARFWKEVATTRSDMELASLRKINGIRQYVDKIVEHDKVVISTVRGSVVGSFLGPFLVADYRIASEDTTFCFPHARWNLPYQSTLAFFLPRYAGPSRARQILLKGEPLDVRAAEDMNLVDHVIPDSGFDEECLRIARRFTEIPTPVVRMTKRLLLSSEYGLEVCFDTEIELMRLAHNRIDMERRNGTQTMFPVSDGTDGR
jgi:2-(1,2-epoxy-1,2-dihydrophenyl)acetyl-CoA isomerase